MIRYWRMPEQPAEPQTRVILGRDPIPGPRGVALISLVPPTSIGQVIRIEGDRVAGEVGVWVR